MVGCQAIAQSVGSREEPFIGRWPSETRSVGGLLQWQIRMLLGIARHSEGYRLLVYRHISIARLRPLKMGATTMIYAK
jgi:hypothetical protein